MYGIELTGGAWWDLFCSRECAAAIWPQETAEFHTLKTFAEQTGVDVTGEPCFKCGKALVSQ